MRNAPPCGISFRTKSYPHSAEEVKVCNVHMMTRREWTMVLPQILMAPVSRFHKRPLAESNILTQMAPSTPTL